jgi:hypothetical protein
MTTRDLPLVFAVLVAGCMRAPRPPPLENDPSIVFPPFFEQSAIEVGAGGGTYALDGVVLRAVMIAANDFLPSADKERPCWDRPESHRYRVIRQGNILFVRIDEDLESCGLQYVSLDTGASYAISTDGRILRRLRDGEPEALPAPATPDAGGQDGGPAPARPEPIPVPPTVPDGGPPGLPSAEHPG